MTESTVRVLSFLKYLNFEFKPRLRVETMLLTESTVSVPSSSKIRSLNSNSICTRQGSAGNQAGICFRIRSLNSNLDFARTRQRRQSGRHLLSNSKFEFKPRFCTHKAAPAISRHLLSSSNSEFQIDCTSRIILMTVRDMTVRDPQGALVLHISTLNSNLEFCAGQGNIRQSRGHLPSNSNLECASRAMLMTALDRQGSLVLQISSFEFKFRILPAREGRQAFSKSNFEFKLRFRTRDAPRVRRVILVALVGKGSADNHAGLLR